MIDWRIWAILYQKYFAILVAKYNKIYSKLSHESGIFMPITLRSAIPRFYVKGLPIFLDLGYFVFIWCQSDKKEEIQF